jgi:hypothetical protein
VIKKKKRLLKDTEISGVRNVFKKEAERGLKCEDFTIAIERMCNAKIEAIPVKIAANGTIPQSFRKYLSNITGKHEIKGLQKTAILGTAHILQKYLHKERFKTFVMRNNITRSLSYVAKTEWL